MRKMLITAALVSSVAVAAPAAAQWNRGYAEGPTRSVQVERQIENLRDRIRRAEDRDLISEREEARLLDRLRGVAERYERFRRNGLSRGEQNELHARLQELRQRLQAERREDRWDDRRDRWDDRRDRWDDRRDRWEDRRGDRRDRWDD